MTKSAQEEFITIDILLQSDAETRSVDVFCLSWIKLEKQLRKLTTNLVFQASDFDGTSEEDKTKIAEVLLRKRRSNHNSFLKAIHKLSGQTPETLIGVDYKILKKHVGEAQKYRNKIFHGQQTGQSLDRKALNSYSGYMRQWCFDLANGSSEHLGYDGFSRGSFQKNKKLEVTQAVDRAIKNCGWEVFIQGL